ncbi:MAG TPA: hypothetical protein VFW85_03655 [Gaiellaceae bacterium]|nr:hypothetical protein [Gaiellaceae bacterium]
MAMVIGLSIGASTASASSGSTKAVAAAAGNPLAEALLKEAGKGILSKGAGAGVSFALTAMGIGGEADTAAALAEIKAQLVRVNEQLTTLRNETEVIRNAVLSSDFSNAVRSAAPLINHVDTAEQLIVDAANAPTAEQRKSAAQEASDYIKSNLLNKSSLIATLAFGSGPLAATSIYGAAVKVRTADDFLTHQESVQLRFLVDVYTAYEAAATQLEVTYYKSKGYADSTLAEKLNAATSRVTAELAMRRDPVPNGTAIDARSGLMWWTKSYAITKNPRTVEGGFLSGSLLFVSASQGTGLSGWRLPTKDEMVALIKGWNGSPADWLSKNGGFAPIDGVGVNAAFWTGTLVSQQVLPAVNLVVYTYWYVRLSDGLVDTLSSGHNQEHGYMAVRRPAENYVPS